MLVMVEDDEAACEAPSHASHATPVLRLTHWSPPAMALLLLLMLALLYMFDVVCYIRRYIRCAILLNTSAMCQCIDRMC